jgi:hypothetical protein
MSKIVVDRRNDAIGTCAPTFNFTHALTLTHGHSNPQRTLSYMSLLVIVIEMTLVIAILM